MHFFSKRSAILSALFCLFLVGCSSGGPTVEQPEGKDERRINRLGGDQSIFGTSFSTGADSGSSNEGSGIGVNGFLWRGTLDTISFFPLSQADPFGGVIITDWYAPPETPNVRFKLNVFILGRELRSDGLRVNVFKQERRGGGAFVDVIVPDETVTSLENAILVRARELRISSLAQD